MISPYAWLPRLLLSVLLAIAGTHPAHALDPGVPLSAYHHTMWTSKEGAPSPITTMAQTSDGWLWLGTPGGLYRFDGVKFSRFVPADGAAMLGSNISNLYAQPDGQLIVGYMGGGLSAVVHDKVVHLARRTLFGPSLQVERDNDGSLWAATLSGLFRLKQGAWVRMGAEHGFPDAVANSVVLDQYGRLWASSKERMYQLDRQADRFVPGGLPGETFDVVRSPDGRVWRDQDVTWDALPLPPGTGLKPQAGWHAPSSSVGIFDHDGNHWAVHCPLGLCRTLPRLVAQRTSFTPQKLATERLNQPWQMSSLTSNTVLEDREGNIWVGTFGGLERFRNNQLVTVPVPPGTDFFAIAADEAGQPLLAPMPKGMLFSPGTPPRGAVHSNLIIAAADDGGVLMADSEGMEIRKGGATHRLAFPPDPHGNPPSKLPIILVGSTNDFWLGVRGAGLFHFQAGKWTPATALGVPNGTRSVSVEPDGTTWFGNRDGTVARLQADQVTRMGLDAGADLGSVNFIDAKHGVVISGDDALAVLIDGKFQRLHARDPELLAGISAMVVTAGGERWFNGRAGAVHISAKAWADALARPDQPVDATVHGILDGFPGVAQEVSARSSAMQSRDGRLWFVGTTGVAYLDPAHQPRNPVPPALYIDRPDVPGASIGPDGSAALPPGTTALRVDYTALSLAKPERVRFRYALDGVDDGWQAAGTRRAAFYTNLGPGHYRFKLMATNEDGVDSVQPASLRITILPTIYQTAWFRAVCVLLLLGALVLAYRWRMRRLALHQWERFQERQSERERIARTLHDNVMQNFQALILFFRMHSARLAPGDAAKTNIDGILGEAVAVMAAAREEITGLRSDVDLPAVDIGSALADFGRGLQAQFGPRFTLASVGSTGHLTAFAAHELQAIGREAIFNAYQHAHASCIDVELGRTGGSFVLAVRDDGRGMDAVVHGDGGRAGHFGLAGMRERARGLGGKITIRARPGGGTEVMLRVPARRITAGRSRRWWRHAHT